MEWNGMEWNGMEWNGMEWNGMEWNAMQCNAMQWKAKPLGGSEGKCVPFSLFEGFMQKHVKRDRTVLSVTILGLYNFQQREVVQ